MPRQTIYFEEYLKATNVNGGTVTYITQGKCYNLFLPQNLEFPPSAEVLTSY